MTQYGGGQSSREKLEKRANKEGDRSKAEQLGKKRFLGGTQEIVLSADRSRQRQAPCKQAMNSQLRSKKKSSTSHTRKYLQSASSSQRSHGLREGKDHRVGGQSTGQKELRSIQNTLNNSYGLKDHLQSHGVVTEAKQSSELAI
jgi:hypothetical protein